MRIGDLLLPADVLTVAAADRREALRHLARHAEGRFGLDATVVLDALVQREALGSTGIGEGVALPHARLAAVEATHGIFAALTRPVEFDSIDDKPVDLIFLLLLPAGLPEQHLKPLACVARRLRGQDLPGRLRAAAADPATLFALLTAE